MKKLIALFIAIMVVFATFSGCSGQKESGGDDIYADKGVTISSAEAKNYIEKIKTTNEGMKEEEFVKFTYSTKMKMDDTINYFKTSFSKEDRYYYTYNYTENMKLYDTYDQETKVYIGTIHQSSTYDYFYVSNDGKLVDAYESHEDVTEKNEQGIFERNFDLVKNYNYLAETMEESIEKFDNDDRMEMLEMLNEIYTLCNTMVSTFEPMIGMGITSIGDMYKIEVRSKGEGHLWMITESPSLGTSTECEFNNYMLTYTKVVTDNAKLGLSAIGYDIMTTETFFDFGVCDIQYPDLSTYPKK